MYIGYLSGDVNQVHGITVRQSKKKKSGLLTKPWHIVMLGCQGEEKPPKTEGACTKVGGNPRVGILNVIKERVLYCADADNRLTQMKT